ncbi:hypothetical protein Cgig2_009703 [Carnegiea gigantea]|uniref:Uncharacterized protein n=1 Tax=Carnegiea gigantea TaxID=171969 RepID=A0A9Q1GRT5_9CARY|nr:hypothetical protein Cgig2_009703 [Carnegiea gigantea]
MDPSLTAVNRLKTCMKIQRLLIPQRRKHLSLFLLLGNFIWKRKSSRLIDSDKKCCYTKCTSKSLPYRSYIYLYEEGIILSEVEDALVGLGSLQTEKENDLVSLLILPKLRNPLDIMKNGSCSIFDRRSLYEKYELGLEEHEGDFKIWNPSCFLFDSIVRPTRLGLPYLARLLQGKSVIYDKDDLKENDLEFLQRE